MIFKCCYLKGTKTLNTIYTQYNNTTFGELTMKTQSILDKFEAVSTTVHVVEKENGDYFTFNEFGVVPVRCDIEYYFQPGMDVKDSFYVDTVTLDTSDDCITFELKDTIKEMINPDDIINLDIVKITQNQYLKAIKEDEKFLDFFD
ncbi:MAG: hypothetical protein U0K80_02675 [Methanobrevibacter sp.]|nr:hypothetical protein [Methanobrevibacter sp.]